MYLMILWMPLMSAIVAGLLGRQVGKKGASQITVISIMITWVMAIGIFYEVVLKKAECYMKLTTWVLVDFGLQYDGLTAIMCVVVTSISLLVHLYSTEYMGEDPHLPRFMSYLSLFTWFMLILVTADNLMQMFVGWEGVGLCSYLLINYWYTRIQANKSAIQAMIVNRIGDLGIVMAIIISYTQYKTLEYSVLIPIVEGAEIEVIGMMILLGAVGKSAQIGLHVWLANAMEGPTPVSALIHAATMVKRCHTLMKVRIEKFRYMLETPEMNKFICTKTKENYETYKKILLFCKKIANMVNQQETSKGGSSETVREKTLDFTNYDKHRVQHQASSDKNYMAWFIGFVEGDGSFVVSKKKVYFDLTQRLIDIRVLNQVKTTLGFGQILLRTEPERRVGVYYVTGKENFLRLVHIFNGNLVTQYKKEQFKNWLAVFNEQYGENIQYIDNEIKPTLTNAWLSGFIDAEGCFMARVRTCRTSRLGKALVFEFSIAQKQKEVLEKIRGLFIDKTTNLRYDKSWEGYSFYLSNRKHLMAVIRYMKEYPLRTLKRVDYFQWARIYELGEQKVHLTEEGLARVEKLCENMHSQESYEQDLRKDV